MTVLSALTFCIAFILGMMAVLIIQVALDMRERYKNLN